jgi:predicted nucleic acid-binding protein
MKYVLDASVALKWFVAEADSAKAIQLREDARHAIHELLVPDFFPVEITHALTRAERQGRITPTEGASFVADLLAELPVLHPSLPVVARAYAIASAARQGVYDCVSRWLNGKCVDS